MKELKHDIESYIITIRRKGQLSAIPQTVVKKTIPKRSLNDPQAPYRSAETAPASAGPDATEITAPLPGIIIDIKVKPGEAVSEGQELAVLEAMKMENSILSPHSGTVREILVSTGDSLPEGTVIMIIG